MNNPLLLRFFPFLSWFPINSIIIRGDLIAGITGALVLVPKAMAYAAVAGLPVAVGLYTAFTPMVIYALLGSSRVLSVSSTTTLAILTGTQLALVVPDGDPAKLATATAALTALTGVLHDNLVICIRGQQLAPPAFLDAMSKFVRAFDTDVRSLRTPGAGTCCPASQNGCAVALKGPLLHWPAAGSSTAHVPFLSRMSPLAASWNDFRCPSQYGLPS